MIHADVLIVLAERSSSVRAGLRGDLAIVSVGTSFTL